MRRFKVEHKNYEKPSIYVTLYCRKVLITLMEGPYTDERILNKTGYNPELVTIKDVTAKEIV